MHYLRILAVSALAIAGVVVGAPAATASQPTREIVPAPDDIVITGQCAFPVLGHLEGSEINMTFSDNAGNPVKLIGVFPGHTVTLTNIDTNKSITLVGSGLFKAQLKRDGSSGSMQVTGHGPSIPNPITGEPGIWYLSGRLDAPIDANGNPTSAPELAGRLVNLCPLLAT
jgi:hypothetical protein